MPPYLPIGTMLAGTTSKRLAEVLRVPATPAGGNHGIDAWEGGQTCRYQTRLNRSRARKGSDAHRIGEIRGPLAPIDIYELS